MALAMILALGPATMAQAETLRLAVETKSDTGHIRAAIYTSQEAFEKGDTLTGVTAPAKFDVTKLDVKGLKPRIYGVALFQDLNGNEKLDRNLFGACRRSHLDFPIIRSSGFQLPNLKNLNLNLMGNFRKSASH